MQATATPAIPATPAQAPAPPATPPTPSTITFTGTDGTTQVLQVPLSQEAVRDLRSRREELSNQLTNVSSRRRRVADEMNQMPAGAARSGLEQRLAVLDKRIAQMESDLAATGKQLSAAPLGLIASTEDPMGPPGDIPDNVMTMIGVFTVFVLFPIAIAVSRFIWRRAGKVQTATVQLPPQVDQRLERLEQGVDAIAIEIERVTEGQRFVTKLLSESQQSLTRLPEARVPAERE